MVLTSVGGGRGGPPWKGGKNFLAGRKKPSQNANPTAGTNLGRPSRRDSVDRENSIEPLTLPVEPADPGPRFAKRFPNRAFTPLSEEEGRRLREEVTDETAVTQTWTQQEGDRTVERSRDVVVERTAVSWADASDWFYRSHRRYEDMSLLLEYGYPWESESNAAIKDLSDAWEPEHDMKRYAEAKAVEREAERVFENPMSAHLTLTAPGIIGGEPVPPVDHLDELTETWSEYVYHDLRNAIRALDFDRSEWLYWAEVQPHLSSENAGYPHLHVWVIVDGEIHRPAFEDLVRTHVQRNEYALPSAHDPAETVTLRDGASGVHYLAKTALHDESLDERDPTYLAWAVLHRATGKPRSLRSDNCVAAIKASRCRWRAKNVDCEQVHGHGHRVEYDGGQRGPDIVCAECGSGWGIDQDRTLTDHRTGENAAMDGSGEIQSSSDVDGQAWVGEKYPGPTWRATAIIVDGEEYSVGRSGPSFKPLQNLGVFDRPPDHLFRCSVCGFSTFEEPQMRVHAGKHREKVAEVVETIPSSP